MPEVTGEDTTGSGHLDDTRGNLNLDYFTDGWRSW